MTTPGPPLGSPEQRVVRTHFSLEPLRRSLADNFLSAPSPAVTACPLTLVNFAPSKPRASLQVQAMVSKLRNLSRFLQLSPPSPSLRYSSSFSTHGVRSVISARASQILGLTEESTLLPPSLSTSSGSFCSRSSNLIDESQGPTAIDYSSLLEEGEFHRLADSTIHGLQEKLEEYGDSVEVDGFDIDYGNDVLTVKLGDLGTYVLNKQTPNRQLWLSSPVSGPSRFDWDQDTKAWIYRRNKANLYKILEAELEQLCGKPIVLS